MKRLSLLRSHSVPSVWLNGRLMALDILLDRNGKDVSRVVDTTDWSLAKLYRWLGY